MKKIILTLFYTVLAAGITLTVFLWVNVLRDNVAADSETRIFIPTGSSYEDLADTLRSSGVLRSERSFTITSRLKSYGRNVKPGSYIIEPGMNNNKIVSMLRSGRQAPVNVTFNNIRTLTSSPAG